MPTGPGRPLTKTGVYCFINLKNNKRYVGSTTKTLGGRKSKHISSLNLGKHFNRHLQSAWKKYGHDSFQFIILELCEPEDCVSREQYFIDFYDTTNDLYGYNIRPFADIKRGIPLSESTKDKLSKINTGKKMPLEVRLRMSEAQRERHRKFPMSEENRRKISERSKGMKVSAETRAKIGAKSKGRVPSAETRAKIAEAWTGKKHTPETIEKMRASHKALWEKRRAGT